MEIHRDGTTRVESVATSLFETNGIHEFRYPVAEVGKFGIRMIEGLRVSIAGGVGCDTGELFAPLQHQALVLGSRPWTLMNHQERWTASADAVVDSAGTL